MKFLVFALAVCTANAASYYGGQSKYPSQAPNRYPTGSVATAQAIVNAPVVPAAKVAQVSAPAPVTRDSTYVPKNADVNTDIIEDVKEQKPDGGFVSRFKTSDGTVVEAVGTKKIVGDAEILTHTGYYKYITDDGQEVYVKYTADENGYVAESPFLPQAPPVPEEILASLEYIAKTSKYVEPVKQY